MTALTQAQADPHQHPVGYALVLALVVLLGLVGVTLPPLNRHAQQAHGGTARLAYDTVRNANPTPGPDRDRGYYRGTDADGQTYHIARLPYRHGSGPVWAVVIVGGGGAFLITAFITGSRRYVDRLKRKCKGGS